MKECDVCFRKCRIEEGRVGFCGARVCRDSQIVAQNYGCITSLALDPIEKKPLNRFHPGSLILSAGSYGCNLRCLFCQNHGISWSEEAFSLSESCERILPEDLAFTAASYRDRGNIGVAFTYNEPLVGYEFVRDTAKLVRQMDMVNVLVTNGTASIRVLDEILPYIDAMNIDLKSFSEDFYRKTAGGDLQMTLDFIRHAARHCHVELTTLIIPSENDSEEEMQRISCFISDLEKECNKDIPLHISRFFPRFHMTDRDATDVRLIYRLAHIASQKLKYVYTGNC